MDETTHGIGTKAVLRPPPQAEASSGLLRISRFAALIGSVVPGVNAGTVLVDWIVQPVTR